LNIEGGCTDLCLPKSYSNRTRIGFEELIEPFLVVVQDSQVSFTLIDRRRFKKFLRGSLGFFPPQGYFRYYRLTTENIPKTAEGRKKKI
jgi:hypothetical protein